MNERLRFLKTVPMIAGLAPTLMAVLMLVSGCGKDHPASHTQAVQTSSGGGCCPPGEQATAPVAADTSHEGHTPAAQPTMGHERAVAEQPPAQAAGTAQTTCPVMGGAINRTLFVEYQGQKVYFCCGGCPETFKANPEKYLAKLPQFQK